MEVDRRTRCSPAAASRGRDCHTFDGKPSTENISKPCAITFSDGDVDQSSQNTSAAVVSHQKRTDNFEPPIVALPSSSVRGSYSRGRAVSLMSHQSGRRS